MDSGLAASDPRRMAGCFYLGEPHSVVEVPSLGLKSWQILCLIWLGTAVTGAYLGWIHSSPVSDFFVAVGITLLGYRFLRRASKNQNK